jgi:hypothetical protein
LCDLSYLKTTSLVGETFNLIAIYEKQKPVQRLLKAQLFSDKMEKLSQEMNSFGARFKVSTSHIIG